MMRSHDEAHSMLSPGSGLASGDRAGQAQLPSGQESWRESFGKPEQKGERRCRQGAAAVTSPQSWDDVPRGACRKWPWGPSSGGLNTGEDRGPGELFAARPRCTLVVVPVRFPGVRVLEGLQ